MSRTPTKKLEFLRKQLPPGPAPITPSLDRLWDLLEEANTPPPHPRQKFITAGLEDESGNPIDWTHWNDQAPRWRERAPGF